MQFTYADPIHSEATTQLGQASTDYFSSPCDESSQGNERTSVRASSVSLASLFSIFLIEVSFLFIAITILSFQ
jgi:hypothetical protein